MWDLFIILVVFVLALVLLYTTKGFAPFLPTLKVNYQGLVDSINVALKDSGKQKFKFIDLGCGTGRILTLVKRSFDTAQVSGVELNPVLYVISKIKSLIFGYKVSFRDLYLINPAKYDMIYIFGFKDTTKKFSDFLKKKGFKGYIISYFFDLDFELLEKVGNYRVYKVI
jgi:SAM-dependent methyltransferase